MDQVNGGAAAFEARHLQPCPEKRPDAEPAVDEVSAGQEREYVNPKMYLTDSSDDGTIYVFASKVRRRIRTGTRNLTSASEGTVERGADTYRMTVRELTGDERNRVDDEQARRYPGFADYAQRTAGMRTILVLELKRSRGQHRVDGGG